MDTLQAAGDAVFSAMVACQARFNFLTEQTSYRLAYYNETT